jgi:hypothetical protein
MRLPLGCSPICRSKRSIARRFTMAPMPYMERLTWGGVALHAGGLPGYPESHGCIHLPSEFARLLFGLSSDGMTVVIGAEQKAPTRVAHPGYLAPVKALGGEPFERAPFASTEEERWHPELSPSGPVSIVLSQGSRRVVVYRNGIEIGRTRQQHSDSRCDAAGHARVLISPDKRSHCPGRGCRSAGEHSPG